ncbi:MAG: diazepam-binding inhibitor (GABA receptor modulating acyl-CoA-binding protein) [Arenicella sp.]|jgi:diazepam-binding inhibitor (GABA receptor modulating acyl-CoA-binding protein)
MPFLKQKFHDIVALVKESDPDFNPYNELKLEMYALFKQATVGDVQGKKPAMIDLVCKAKYSAWGKLKGISTDAVMQSYMDKVGELT